MLADRFLPALTPTPKLNQRNKYATRARGRHEDRRLQFTLDQFKGVTSLKEVLLAVAYHRRVPVSVQMTLLHKLQR
jgi:hypothetical protein